MKTHRWFLIFWFVLLLCFVFISSSLAQENLPAIVKKVEPSTVVILTYDKEGKILGQGSGFFISQNGDIITNRHVLKGASRAEIKTSQGKVFPITNIIAEDKEGDLIRVSLDIPSEIVHPLSLSTSIPEKGEKVVVIGSPLGLESSVSDGIISAVRDIPTFGNIIQITAPISHGSSGSPVVNMKGEVIGVATFQLIEGQQLNFAIPSERIARFKAEKRKTFNEWNVGILEDWLASAEGLYNKGLTFIWIEDYKNALPYFEKAVKENPNYADAYYCIGHCNNELKRYTEAIEACKQAIRIKPDFAEAYNCLGAAYNNLRRWTEAIEASKQAIRIKPDLAGAHCCLGVAYSGLERYNEAIEASKQAIHIKPDYAEAYCCLGVAYIGIKRYSEAIEAAKQAIRIEPDFAEAHFGLGVAYSGLERYNEAIVAYKQAIRIKPDLAEAHHLLGLYCFRLGDRNSALEEYKILKSLNGDLANELFNEIYK